MKIALLPVLALLGGCIIYDHDKCPNCDTDFDSGVDHGNPGNHQTGDDTATQTDDTGTTTPAETHFYLDPDYGSPSATIITSLTADNFDLNTIANVRFYGDVNILAQSNRGTELLLTLQVPPNAALGTADLLLELNDGTARLIEKAFTIVEDGAGDPDPNNGPNGGTGGTDTGNPSVGTDTGGCN